MALIKNISEIQKYVSVRQTLSLISIEPALNDVERNFIRKYLGFAQYNALDIAYNGDDALNINDKSLLNEVQPALAKLTIASHLNVGRVDIDDNGVTQKTSTAHGFTIAEVKAELTDKGLEALEQLLEFLEENKANYPLWAASPAYTVLKKYFINTTAEFSAIVDIGNSRCTFLALAPIMRKVEQLSIEKAIGKEFMAEIKAQIAAGTLSNDNKLLLPEIQAAVAYATVLEALQTQSYELREGAIRLTLFMSDGTGAKQLASNATIALESKISKAQEDAACYLTRLTEYLNNNASADKYSVYFGSSLYKTPSADPLPSINQTTAPTGWF